MDIYTMFSLISLTLLLSHYLAALSELVTVKVQLNHNATLPCRGRCSGLVRWTDFFTSDPVAQCNQTCCSSLREGFMMLHDQFLTGDWSLVITGADYRKRNLYTCDCDGTGLCDVTLRILPVEMQSVVKVGGSLIMSVPVPENVKVEFRGDDVTEHSAAVCQVKGHQYKCESEYNKRSSLSTSLQLNNLRTSDSGVYTVKDTENDELITTYRTTVTDSSHWIWLDGSADQNCDTGVPVWIFVLVVVLLLVLLVLLGVVVVYFLRQRQQLLKKLKYLNNEPMLQ